MIRSLQPIPFVPHPFLHNPHVMTLAQQCQFRSHLLRHLPLDTRVFSGNGGMAIQGLCHWQPKPRQALTVVLVHGLEGSSESSYMVGIASKAWRQGFNVIRLDVECEAATGKKIPLSLAHDPDRLCSVLYDLQEQVGLSAFSLVGYSLGGNVVLRLAGQEGKHQEVLRHTIAVSPPLDPASSLRALEAQENWLYHRFLIRRLKMRMWAHTHGRTPTKAHPRRPQRETVRRLVETHALPESGHHHLPDYLDRINAARTLEAIRIPTLIVSAQDDPLVPFHAFPHDMFEQNPFLTLLSPQRGGHCSFIQSPQKHEDVHWAENRVVEFLQLHRPHPFHAHAVPPPLFASSAAA